MNEYPFILVINDLPFEINIFLSRLMLFQAGRRARHACKCLIKKSPGGSPGLYYHVLN